MGLIKKLFGNSEKKIEKSKNLHNSVCDTGNSIPEKVEEYFKLYLAKYPGIYTKEEYIQGMRSCSPPTSPDIISNTEEPNVSDDVEKNPGIHIFLNAMGLKFRNIKTIHSLNRFCIQNGFFGTLEKDYLTQTNLKKGVLRIKYNSNGSYKEFISSEMRVEGPLFM